MFERPEHRLVLEVLQGLRSDVLALREQLGPIPDAAWRKAEAAYKSAPKADLVKALDAFAEDPVHRRRCFDGLSVVAVPRILDGLALLRQDLGLPRVSP
jgi:hypothetical protein